MSERVFFKALRYLASRPRSEAQIRELLQIRTEAEPGEIDDCIERLKDLGFINDFKFAQNFLTHRLSIKPLGRERLARELASRKVPQDTISRALDEFFGEKGEEEYIDRAIEKSIRTKGRPVDSRGVRRLARHLARMGFQYDLIMRKIRTFSLSENPFS